MKRRFSVLLALALVLSLMVPTVAMAAVPGQQISNQLEAVITVEKVEVPDTIQDLINEAGEGATVEVPAGTYEEDQITINKSLTLKPAEDAKVTIQGHITVAASNVTVEGFTIKKTKEQAAITLLDSNIVIMRNTIDGAQNADTGVNGAGIRVNNGTSATIEGNTIINNSGNGIWVDLGSGDELTIKGNTIEGNRTGVNFNSSQAESVSILENTFETNSAHGISIGTNTTATTFIISDNTFTGNVRSHFSDRRYSGEDATVSPSREDILNNNTIEGLHAWAWNEDGVRWLLVPGRENMLKMSWEMDGGLTDGTLDGNNVLKVTVNENEEKNAAVTAEFGDILTTITEEGTIKEIGKVLFVMEITDGERNFVNKDILTVIAADGQSLGCNYDNSGFWYWGPRAGFPFADENGVTTSFTYTFNQAGTYNIKIYAVQL